MTTRVKSFSNVFVTLFLRSIFTLYIWPFCLHICLCIFHMDAVPVEAKRGQLISGTVLRLILSHRVGPGTQIPVLCKSIKCFFNQ